jgi:lysophospholipase L1-like esterase
MTLRRLAIATLALPLLAACVSNETVGTRPNPSGGEMFASYVAIGTSIGAGIRSGGLDSIGQKAAYPYLLATAMGLTPGVDWHWPKINGAGCPAPYSNILTSTRLSAVPCGYRDPATTALYENNVSIPSIRVAQVWDITRRDFPATDTLGLAQFLTGSMNPVDMAVMARPTFVTLEIGINDVLGASTRGDTTFLTRVDSFQVQFRRIADKIDATGAKVAVANLISVTTIPHFSMGAIYYCLKNGGCPAPFPPATVPFSLATFTVDATCAPVAPAVGLTTLIPFGTLGRILGALTAGGSASLNCGTGVVTATGSTAAQLPTLVTAEVTAIETEIATLNAFIASEATARGYALVDLRAVMAAQQAAGNVPAFPNLSAADPNTLMGTLFSQDGEHPTAAGHVLIANAFKAAINAKFGSAL